MEEPERLEPTLAERLEASEELVAEEEAETAHDDAQSRSQRLRARMIELRTRLVVEEPEPRWWRPRNR